MTEPTEVEAMRGHFMEKIAAGSDHSLVLSTAGMRTYVFAFGANGFGQLGTEGSDTGPIPRLIKELASVRIFSIAAGNRFSLALSSTSM